MSITRGLRTLNLKWPHGEAVKAWQLIAGREYQFNAVTGVMQMAKPPPGPKEMQNRAMREQRIEQNKRLIDSTVKTRARIIGQVKNVKAKPKKPTGRGR